MFTVRMSSLSVVFLVLGLLFPLASPARGADFTFKPRISTTMEYNDNVTETQNPKGDYLWIIKPGLSATYSHSRVLFDLSYDFQTSSISIRSRAMSRIIPSTHWAGLRLSRIYFS